MPEHLPNPELNLAVLAHPPLRRSRCAIRLFEVLQEAAVGTSVGEGGCKGEDVGGEQVDVEVEVFEEVLGEDGEVLAELGWVG